MNIIHDNKVKNIAEYNLPYDILNPSKRTKNINNHNYPILHGGMNTRRGKEKSKLFQILLNSEYSSTIITRRLI